MVVTVNKMWSTIEHSLPLNLLKLLNECSVKLVYLGQLCFGELKLRRPSLNLPSLPVQTSVHPSTSKQPDTSTSTDSTTGNTASAAAVAQTDQTPTLPVATTPPAVETSVNNISVETKVESTGNVETDVSWVHVETQRNEHGSLHVETTTDQPVTLHVHVETPDKANLSCEAGKNQAKHPVQKPIPAEKQAKVRVKSAKLHLTPLDELEIDVWCNKTVEYHQFAPPPPCPKSSNDTGYSLHTRKPKVSASGILLRKTNSVNYALMMDSNDEDID